MPINITWRQVFFAVVSLLLIAGAAYIAHLMWPALTGFGGRTFWDWMELLIIPAVLGIGAIVLNQAMRIREQERAEDQRREEVLQKYLDNMGDLLLNKKLLEQKDDLDKPVVRVGQANTVTALGILDHNRKDILFQFIRDANLASFILVKGYLKWADLCNAHMININLSGARLYKADLSRANLSDVDLSEAELREADLSKADLTGVNLTGADLSGADLTDAEVSLDQLQKAKSLEGATLPNGSMAKYEGHLSPEELEASADVLQATFEHYFDMAMDHHEMAATTSNILLAIVGAVIALISLDGNIEGTVDFVGGWAILIIGVFGATWAWKQHERYHFWEHIAYKYQRQLARIVPILKLGKKYYNDAQEDSAKEFGFLFAKTIKTRYLWVVLHLFITLAGMAIIWVTRAPNLPTIPVPIFP